MCCNNIGINSSTHSCKYKQETQLSLTNSATRLEVKSQNMVQLGMVSYLCAIVTLSLRRTIFEIFDFKYAVILKTRLGSVTVIENVTIR